MNPGEIIVYRDAIELCRLTVKDAIELLNAGFLLPTDNYREEPTAECRTLAGLESESASKRESFANVKNVVSAVGQSASRVVNKLVSATSLGSDVLGSAVGRLLRSKFIGEVSRNLDRFAAHTQNAPEIRIPRAIRREVDPTTVGRHRDALDQLVPCS